MDVKGSRDVLKNGRLPTTVAAGTRGEPDELRCNPSGKS